MSAKSMFFRLFRIPQTPDADAMAWLIEREDAPTAATRSTDAAAIPLNMRQAEPGEIKKLDDTMQMPPVRDDSAEISVMRWQPSDEEVTSWALRNLRRLSPETLAAGLRAYVQQHPVAA